MGAKRGARTGAMVGAASGAASFARFTAHPHTRETIKNGNRMFGRKHTAVAVGATGLTFVGVNAAMGAGIGAATGAGIGHLQTRKKRR